MKMTNLVVIEQAYVGKRVIIAGTYLPCKILRGTCHSIQQLPSGINVFHINLDNGNYFQFSSENVLLFSATEAPPFNTMNGPRKLTFEPTGHRARLNARLKIAFMDKNQLHDALDAGLPEAVNLMANFAHEPLKAKWIIEELERGHVQEVIQLAKSVRENENLILEWIRKFIPEYLYIN